MLRPLHTYIILHIYIHACVFLTCQCNIYCKIFYPIFWYSVDCNFRKYHLKIIYLSIIYCTRGQRPNIFGIVLKNTCFRVWILFSLSTSCLFFDWEIARRGQVKNDHLHSFFFSQIIISMTYFARVKHIDESSFLSMSFSDKINQAMGYLCTNLAVLLYYIQHNEDTTIYQCTNYVIIEGPDVKIVARDLFYIKQIYSSNILYYILNKIRSKI